LSVDCEFVQCGNRQALARISIVDERCEVVMDEYVKPNEKVTNFITFVSGITYQHIRNAPAWRDIRPKV
jgi:RNA exonuclease 4